MGLELSLGLPRLHRRQRPPITLRAPPAALTVTVGPASAAATARRFNLSSRQFLAARIPLVSVRHYVQPAHADAGDDSLTAIYVALGRSGLASSYQTAISTSQANQIHHLGQPRRYVAVPP